MPSHDHCCGIGSLNHRDHPGLSFDIDSCQLLTKGQNGPRPASAIKERVYFSVTSNTVICRSIIENDFQPALPGLAPLFPGKSHRNLKAGTAPSGFSFCRLPVMRMSPSERRATAASSTQSKKGKATSQAEFELRCALWASTKRIMEVETMVSNLTAENRLPRSPISKMILLISPGVSDSSTTSEDLNILNLNMKENECHHSLQDQMTRGKPRSFVVTEGLDPSK